MSSTGPTVSLSARRTAGIALLMGVLAAGVGACRSTPGSGRTMTIDQRHAAVKVNPDDYAKLGYRLSWQGFPVVGSRQQILSVDAYSDAVIVQDTGSTVTALEGGSGAQRWSSQLSTPLTKFVGNTRQDNHLISCSEAEAFILDMDTGRLVDRQPYASVVATHPVLFGNMAIFGTGRGELLAHVLNVGGVRGVKAWGDMLDGSISKNPVLIGGIVGAVSDRGDVLFADAQSGQMAGRNHIYSSLVGALAADPGANDGIMFVASLDQSLYAFTPNGIQLWRYRTSTPLRRSPVAVGSTVYCAIDGQGLVAFQSGNGGIRWTSKGVDGKVVGIRNKRLLVWDGSAMTTIDPASGDVFDRVPLPGVGIISLDKFEDGNFYATSKEGVVSKFVPR
jgi:hypothetical protein